MPQTKRRLMDVVRRSRVISLLALPLAVAGALAQYAPPKPIDAGTSAVRGRIVDAQSGEPVADLAVRLFSTRSFATGSTQTNAEGIYEFAGIAAGPYSLSVDTRTYLPACRQTPEQSSPACSQFALAEDQIRSDLDFRLMPGAVARGRVTDSGGRALRATVRLGVPYREPASALVRPAATMPDGTFALTGIPPGTWTLELELPRAEGRRPPILYYPGVVSRDETVPIEFRAGIVTNDVNFVVPVGATRTITMKVRRPAKTGAVVSAAVLRASPVMAMRVDLNAEGVGIIKNLSEGRYFVAARSWSDRDVLVASGIVDLVTDSQEIQLTLRRAGRITGKVVTERGGLPPIDGLRVGAAWVHDDVEINPLVPDQVAVSPDGKFRIDGLFGRRAMQLIGLSADWRIRSVRQGRRDVTRGVEVTPARTVDVTIVVGLR